MTVPSETYRSGPYIGNGVTTVFDYSFRVTNENHLLVIKNVAGVETTLAIGTDYTVSGVGDVGGGQITAAVAPLAAQTITILLNVPLTQEIDLENHGAYYAETIENALDLAAMRDQQLQEQIDRSVKIPASADPSELTGLIADVLRLSESADEIDVVAGIAGNVTTVAGIAGNVTTVAGIAGNVTTVAGIADDVPAVAAVASDIPTVAANVADITNFADVYQGAKSVDPVLRNNGSPLEQGDLYFSTSLGAMRFYNGAAWQSVTDQSLNISIKSFVGDGATTEFVLDLVPGVVANLLVEVDGVIKTPTTDYTVAGNTLTMASAPANTAEINTWVFATTAVLYTPAAASVTALSITDDAEEQLRILDKLGASRNYVSLLSVLTDAEVIDVLDGTNSIDISAKIAAAITALAANAPGFTFDMSMLNGSDITVTQDWFAGLATAKGRIITGAVKLLVNFNNMNFRLPSHMIWEARGTKIESSTTITAVANGEGGIGYLVNTFVGGAGRTCSSTTSNTVTVSDASGIEVGTTIAVFGTQRDFIFSGITLGSAITSGTTSIPISGASTIDPALVMLRFTGTEYAYGLLSGGTFNTAVSGGGRGKLGSAATSHLNGAAVLVLQSMVRTVIAKSGNVLTLDADVDITFSNAEFRFGTVGSRIVGDLQIDGKDNKGAASSASWNCLGGTLSADLSVVGPIKLIGGLTSGYMLMGARRTTLDIDSIDLCGRPANTLGGSGWLFGSCRDINVHVKRTSNGNISNAIDNKSSGLFSMGLWQPNYRFHIVHDVVLSHKTAHDVTASSDGYCGTSYADCSDSLAGIFDGLPQAPAAITPTGVTIEIKGFKTFFAPTGSSLGGTNNLVRIGSYVSGPIATLTVDGAADDSRLVFKSAGVTKWNIQNTTNRFNIFNGAFSAGVYLASQAATSWTAVSDRRVKTDIKTLSVLDRLEGFNAVSYINKLTGAREVGVIAQDEIARAPEFVHRGSGSDDDVISSMDDPRMWAMIYDRYGVEALQGVKELFALVQQQQIEIDALKKQ